MDKLPLLISSEDNWDCRAIKEIPGVFAQQIYCEVIQIEDSFFELVLTINNSRWANQEFFIRFSSRLIDYKNITCSVGLGILCIILPKIQKERFIIKVNA